MFARRHPSVSGNAHPRKSSLIEVNIRCLVDMADKRNVVVSDGAAMDIAIVRLREHNFNALQVHAERGFSLSTRRALGVPAGSTVISAPFARSLAMAIV